MQTRTKTQAAGADALIKDAIERTRVMEREGSRVQREGGRIVDNARAERATLEEALRAAAGKVKGTRDVTAQARAAATIEARIEGMLRGSAPLSPAELAGRLGEPEAKVDRALTKLAATPCASAADDSEGVMTVFNHGTDVAPRWGWVCGDAVDTETLYGEIESMVRRRPYTFAELRLATGARRGRVSGGLVQFTRSDLPVWTVSESERAYRWFIGDVNRLRAVDKKHARRARLEPDKTKG